jgi:hypothetical protein
MSILLKTINASDTTLMMSTDISFPNSDGVIKIGSEIIIYDELYMGTLYGCVRGARSTAAASHTTGATISLIDFYAAAPVPTPGEVNTASNVGSGEGLFAQKVLEDLQFKSLTAGNGITLTPSTDDITFSVTDPLPLTTGLDLAIGSSINFSTTYVGVGSFKWDDFNGQFILGTDGDGATLLTAIGGYFRLGTASGNTTFILDESAGIGIQVASGVPSALTLNASSPSDLLTVNNTGLGSPVFKLKDYTFPASYSVAMASEVALTFQIGITTPVDIALIDANGVSLCAGQKLNLNTGLDARLYYAAGVTELTMIYPDAGSWAIYTPSGLLATTPSVQGTATDVSLGAGVNLFLQGGTAANPSVQLGSNDGLFSPTQTGDLSVSSLGIEIARFDASAVAGDTRFMLWDVDSGALVRVSVGIANSGGVGYKVLCIPN